jgi:hypothetical protein
MQIGLLKSKLMLQVFSLLDNIAGVVDMPIYDEYGDNYEVDFLEQPTACSPPKNVPFQQYSEIHHLTYHSCKEESYEPVAGNALPLCFPSFKLLKENSKIIIDEGMYVDAKSH